MDAEKFDDQLRSAILDHDETSQSVFNRNRVWRKSTGNRRRKTLTAVIYIAATLLVALNIIWINGEKPMDVHTKKRVESSTATVTLPELPIVQKPASVPVSNPVSVISQNRRNIEIAEQTIAKPTPITTLKIEPVNTVPVNNGLYYPKEETLASIKPESAKAAEPTQINEDMKVTFIRGKMQDDNPPPDVRITFRRGSKVKTEIKNTARDSLYYAEERPFRLKFKN